MAVEGGVTQAFFPEGASHATARSGRRDSASSTTCSARSIRPVRATSSSFPSGSISTGRWRTGRFSWTSRRGAPKGTGRGRRGRPPLLGRNALLLASNRWHRFGYACVSFGPPISLRGWCTTRRLDPRCLPKDERIARAGELAAELMGAVAASSRPPGAAGGLPPRRGAGAALFRTGAEAGSLSFWPARGAGARAYVPGATSTTPSASASGAEAPTSRPRGGRLPPRESRPVAAPLLLRQLHRPLRAEGVTRPVQRASGTAPRAPAPTSRRARNVEARVDARETPYLRAGQERVESPRRDPVGHVADVSLRVSHPIASNRERSTGRVKVRRVRSPDGL